jgi:hypothetical protein
MEFADDLFILFEERIIPRSKTHQGRIPILSPSFFLSVAGIISGKLNNSLFNKPVGVIGKPDLRHKILPRKFNFILHQLKG